MEKTFDEVKARVDEFMSRLFDLYVAEHQRMGYLPFKGMFVAEYGQKNVRIVIRERDSGGYVYCFVELATGDILKAAGFKAPAKGKRGSIWNEDCDVRVEGPANLHGSGLYKR
jgi:hypothetical protein